MWDSDSASSVCQTNCTEYSENLKMKMAEVVHNGRIMGVNLVE